MVSWRKVTKPTNVAASMHPEYSTHTQKGKSHPLDLLSLQWPYLTHICIFFILHLLHLQWPSESPTSWFNGNQLSRFWRDARAWERNKSTSEKATLQTSQRDTSLCMLVKGEADISFPFGFLTDQSSKACCTRLRKNSGSIISWVSPFLAMNMFFKPWWHQCLDINEHSNWYHESDSQCMTKYDRLLPIPIKAGFENVQFLNLCPFFNCCSPLVQFLEQYLLLQQASPRDGY